MTRILLSGCVAFLAMTTALHAQSFAGIAKKAEEDRAKAKQEQSTDSKKTDKPPATKAYTNKDLSDVPPSSAPAPAPAPAPAAAPVANDTPDKATPEKPDEQKKDEAYWRGRVAPLNQRIRDNTPKLAAMKSRIDKLTSELLDIGPLNTRRAGVETERQRLITESQAMEQSLVADLAAVKAIEEEGRRAGALPGWFRN